MHLYCLNFGISLIRDRCNFIGLPVCCYYLLLFSHDIWEYFSLKVIINAKCLSSVGHFYIKNYTYSSCVGISHVSTVHSLHSLWFQNQYQYNIYSCIKCKWWLNHYHSNQVIKSIHKKQQFTKATSLSDLILFHFVFDISYGTCKTIQILWHLCVFIVIILHCSIRTWLFYNGAWK